MQKGRKVKSTVIATTLAAALLSPAGPSACPGGKGAASNTNRTVCIDIHTAINNAMLDDRATQAQIELAAAKSGVNERIRTAIDSYYRGDKAAGRQAMLTACADAGYPA